MGSQSTSPNQIISLPKGGGAQQGLGEKFSPDLHTGTGNFTVPIAVPPGRNGFQPQLNLVYSTGNGNGLFGLGWGLGIPGVTRKTSKGIPRYQDYDQELKKRDTFILSGAEDLVPILDTSKATQYRPRTEGLFAKIIHQHDAQIGTNYWEVCSKDGLISFYGTNPIDQVTYHPDFLPRTTPATTSKPKPNAGDPDRVFAWKLTLTKDPFENRIEYLYENRDQSAQDERQGHHWDQPLLTQIRYADYQENDETKFLVTVSFEYEEKERPDPFSDYRAGFEIRTTKRCKAILVETHADKDFKVRRYEFTYRNDALNKVSLLRAIDVVGFDDGGTEARELPPLEFGYSDFKPQDQARRDFYPVQGPDLPATSLANSSVELVDLFGNGLPDVLEMNGAVRYWRNRGNGRFDLPRPMAEAPAGLTLASVGVQLIDANGDGRTDLLVTEGALSGYYPLQFGGRWDRRSFQKYAYAPSFDLKDPEVRLIDLTGDGVTDVIRSGSRLECFFNDSQEGWKPGNTRWVERQALEVFPNVNFSDSRVKFADMTGDGMQDIVLVYDGNVEYWPNLGYGSWGKRLHMGKSPRFPYGYDPKRILLGDVDGDGLADLIYIDDRKVTLWINQNGNGWSDPIDILGTPPVSDMDATRLVDLLGSGISGVLWTKDATSSRQDHYLFFDLTGGTKPYILHEMNNNMGAITKVGYEPSTKFYLEDEKKIQTRWRTPLPFPVQVVARVEVIDEISKGKLTTEFKYHHGYWDGAEREFRGFGMVEQCDTESFDKYGEAGLHGVEAFFAKVDRKHFSPPTLTKTWFHQGPIGEEFGDWQEQNWSSQYWQDDPQILKHTESVYTFLQGLTDRRVKRDALRTLRGSILRTELYALDATEREDHPYTVTEHAYGLREESPPAAGEKDRPHIFFPHALSQRTTQWERGTDPLTQFTFTDYRDENGDFDPFGRPLRQMLVACPRGWRGISEDSNAYLSTCTRTDYAVPLNSHQLYIHDRVSRTTIYEITNKTEADEPTNNASRTVLQIRDLTEGHPALKGISQTLNFYDGAAFVGADFGHVGQYGALVRTESLVLTEVALHDAYKRGNDVLTPAEKPPYLTSSGVPSWTEEYPKKFRDLLQAKQPTDPDRPGLVTSPTGHGFAAGNGPTSYARGYFVAAERRRYDFHADSDGRGLVLAERDPLGRDTTVRYDDYGLLPTEVTDSVGLQTKAEYNNRVLQPREITDPNGNRTRINFTPIGLPKDTSILGKTSSEGDQQRPSITMEYDFLAFAKLGEPVYVRTLRQLHHDTEMDVSSPQRDETIETREYSDGFGRLLQTRAQAEDMRFGHAVFGGGEAVLPAKQSDGAGGDVVGQQNTDPMRPNVVVSGWQVYDNKGKVVEKYEPFFSEGWSYTPPTDDQLGQKAEMFYDPRGQVIRTLNPDGSEQRVIYGIPNNLDNPTNPDEIAPTPWEAYTYDANDNAGRTHPNDSVEYRHHWNTPSNIVIDALGRAVVAVERNRAKPASGTGALPAVEEYRTRSTYDIQGNLLTVTDALNRVAFSHVYDLAKRPLRIDSIDAGTRIMVSDAIGNEIERRDSKGALALRSYDVLNRPDRIWARNDAVQSMTLHEMLSYGDGGRSDQPSPEREAGRANNSLGKPVVHKDEAGELSIGAYDFKGNLVTKTRKVIADESITAALGVPGALARSFTVDWDNPPSLEGAYETSMNYDALNRVKTMQYPEDVGDSQQLPTRKILFPYYNHAGALERVALDTAIYVERIAYNAKGQRILIVYSNGIMTRHAYDPKTFRLIRMRTEKYLTPLPALGTYIPSGGLLQDYAYEYDLAGNILAIHERVSGCGVNGSADGSNALNRKFQYDGLYRLTRATGRESSNIANPRPWEDLAREGYNSGNHGTANQNNAPNLTLEYWEAYQYDPAGNMLALSHSNNWTRRFGMAGFTPKQWQEKVSDFLAGGSPAWGTQGNRLTNFGKDENQSQSHTFDSNGNLTREFTNRHFSWDCADRMIAFADRATAASPASKEAIYLYDAGGQRIKKLVRQQTGEIETATYINGIFEHHRWSKPGQPTMANNTLHVMDNQSRIAMVRVGNAFSGDGAPNVSVKYHLGDHLGSSSMVIGGTTATGGTFINREEYFPYGETSFGSFGRKRYRFTGKERDEESGIYCFGVRYFAPYLARWFSPDPSGATDGINLYRFVRDNPFVGVDHHGLGTAPLPQDASVKPASPEIKPHDVDKAASSPGSSKPLSMSDVLSNPVGPLTAEQAVRLGLKAAFASQEAGFNEPRKESSLNPFAVKACLEPVNKAMNLASYGKDDPDAAGGTGGFRREYFEKTGKPVPTKSTDAFGHCYAGCEAARRCGLDAASVAGQTRELARESGFYRGPHDSFSQDVHNEQRGIMLYAIVGKNVDCKAECTDAVDWLLDLTAPDAGVVKFMKNEKTGEIDRSIIIDPSELSKLRTEPPRDLKNRPREQVR